MGTIVNEADKIRVLVVEDEFFIAEWVAESLSDLGFAVEIASNARDALHCLKSASVDVLFTDINLPGGMDGAALARRARQVSPELPVIYASARVATLEPEARVSGAVFIRKPYEPEMVGRLIAEVTRPIPVAVPA
jgi:two-component system, response regulator PdtaR